MISFYEEDTDINNSQYYALKQACTSGVLSTVPSILQFENSTRQDLHQPEPLTQRHLQKCLFEAFANSNFDVAGYLIREAGVEMKPIERHLALHASRNCMPVEMFEFLIQEGWNINTPISEFRTALRYFPLITIIIPLTFILTNCLLFPTFLTLAMFYAPFL
jgi:hypothetical protein